MSRSRNAPTIEAEQEKLIGRQLRLARLELGWTQDELGRRLGVTFQQVQKYERGSNRIACSRLYRAAMLLNKPILYFFEPLVAGKERMQDPVPTVETTWALQVMKEVSAIREPKLQKLVAAMLRLVAQLQAPSSAARPTPDHDECMC